jgi:predicted type IV restriction endonuclease
VPSLEHAVEAVLERAERGPMNESNTKVLLVEPVLQALGWDTTNLDCVTREHKVYDGTFLDYALVAGGRPVLFVEAKAWGTTLSDPRWMAQTRITRTMRVSCGARSLTASAIALVIIPWL